MIYSGNVKEGVVNWDGKGIEGLENHLLRAYEGKGFYFEVKKSAKMKTLAQLRAFHGPIVEQVQVYYRQEHGVNHSKEKIKLILKQQFIGYRVREVDGEPIFRMIKDPADPTRMIKVVDEYLPSLAELTRDEFIDFINAITDHFLHQCGWMINIDPPWAKELRA